MPAPCTNPTPAKYYEPRQNEQSNMPQRLLRESLCGSGLDIKTLALMVAMVKFLTVSVTILKLSIF